MRVKALFGALALLIAAQVHALQVTDDRGVMVTLAQPPQRIVTLLPSLAETICELGACDRIVGVDDYTNWPASLQRLPRIGGVEDASIERIVALRPDLVVLSATSRALGRLEGLGIPVFGLELKTLADVERTFLKLGQLLAAPGAGQGWERIRKGIEEAARSVPGSVRGTTVYFEVASGPYGASESSHIGEVLSRLGASNIVPASLGSVPKLNPEFVVRADPQVIMMMEGNSHPLDGRPGWQRIRAVRDGRVCVFTAAQADVIARPGPRLADSARLLAQCLRGTLTGATR